MNADVFSIAAQLGLEPLPKPPTLAECRRRIINCFSAPAKKAPHDKVSRSVVASRRNMIVAILRQFGPMGRAMLDAHFPERIPIDSLRRDLAALIAEGRITGDRYDQGTHYLYKVKE